MATTQTIKQEIRPVLQAQDIMWIQQLVRQVPASQHMIDYAVDLVRATRPKEQYSPDFVKNWLAWGAGPRAAQNITLTAKARAIIYGRYAVTAEDIRTMCYPVLRHRIFTNFNADAEGVDVDKVIEKILETVPEPTYGETVAAKGKKPAAAAAAPAAKAASPAAPPSRPAAPVAAAASPPPAMAAAKSASTRPQPAGGPRRLRHRQGKAEFGRGMEEGLASGVVRPSSFLPLSPLTTLARNGRLATFGYSWFIDGEMDCRSGAQRVATGRSRRGLLTVRDCHVEAVRVGARGRAGSGY